MISTLGKYLLAGTLLTGTAYSQENSQLRNLKDFYPQPTNLPLFKQPDSTKKDLTKKVLEDKKKSPNLIYGKGDLTSAGNGFFLSSYIYPAGDASSDYDFRKMFSSKDKLSYSALTSKKVKKIIKNSSLDRSVINIVRGCQEKVKKNSVENHQKFNQAIKDGILTQKEMENIGEGTYAYLVSTGKQGVVGFIKIRGKKEGKLEKKLEGAFQESANKNALQEYIQSGTYLWQGIKTDEKKAGQEEAQLQSAQPIGLSLYYPDTFELKQMSKVSDALQAETADTSMHPFPKNNLYPSQKDTLQAIDSSMHPNAQDALGRRAADSLQAAKRIKFGVEASAGTELEGIIGGFVSVPASSWLNLDAYAGFFANNGYYIARNASEIITARETELIGPATYKKRTDEIKTISKKSPIAEIGTGAVVDLGKGFGIPMRAGIEIFKEEKTKIGRSTIEFERNNSPLRTPSVIENTAVENSTGSKFALSAGLAYKINSSLSVEALFNSGLKNSGRLKLKYTF